MVEVGIYTRKILQRVLKEVQGNTFAHLQFIKIVRHNVTTSVIMDPNNQPDLIQPIYKQITMFKKSQWTHN